jgi:hypothetical protein
MRRQKSWPELGQLGIKKKDPTQKKVFLLFSLFLKFFPLRHFFVYFGVLEDFSTYTLNAMGR